MSATAANTSLDVDVYDLDGKSVGTLSLPDAWFGGEANIPLVHQVVTAQLANARRGSAQTKNRTRIRGGGRKPWRQKGTGRARHGSIRSPMWTGGAVAHGRRADENHGQRINRKMKRAALRSALSDRARTAAISVVRGLSFPQPKTKHAAAVLAALGHADVKRILVVLASEDAATKKSFRNLQAVRILAVDQLNTYDVVRSDIVVFDEAAIELIGTGTHADAPTSSGTPTIPEPAPKADEPVEEPETAVEDEPEDGLDEAPEAGAESEDESEDESEEEDEA